MNDDDAILGEGEVCVALPAVFIIGLVRVLLGDTTQIQVCGVSFDVYIYPGVVVRRDGDCVEIFPCTTVPQADLVLAKHHNYVYELFSKILRTWSAQQTKFPSRSRET